MRAPTSDQDCTTPFRRMEFWMGRVRHDYPISDFNRHQDRDPRNEGPGKIALFHLLDDQLVAILSTQVTVAKNSDPGACPGE
jgi:hypothetical protein